MVLTLIVALDVPCWPSQAVRVVMVIGVLECGFLLINNIQDRFEGQEAWEKRPAVT